MGNQCFHPEYDAKESENQDQVNPLAGHGLHNQYPHMRGSIYIKNINDTNIESCTFTRNDAGPILEDYQVVGLIDVKDGGNVERASSIYIDKGVRKVEISQSLFHENQVDFLRKHIQIKNIGLFNFFPPDYFSSSFSPIINIHMSQQSEDPCDIAIFNSTFRDQRNMEILGYEQQEAATMDMKYYASLLSANSLSLLL